MEGLEEMNLILCCHSLVDNDGEENVMFKQPQMFIFRPETGT
jgi:hypothetical protein